MNRLRIARKLLTRDAVVVLGIVTVIGLVSFAVYSYASSKEAEIASANAAMMSLGGEADLLEQKIGTAETSLTKFQMLKTRFDGKGYILNRDRARLSVNELRNRLRLVNLKLEISPEELFTDPEATKFTTVETTYCIMRISFDAIADLHVYAFLDALPKTLPGFVRFRNFSIERNGQLNDENLTRISRGEQTTTVSSEIDVLWIGIRAKGSPQVTETQAAAP